MEAVDIKTVERVRKLLNLARDGGATEAEAALAMERAQAIMLDNNLSMATVEATSGAAAEKRTKETDEKRANYWWQRSLMEAIAQANFCHLSHMVKKLRIRGGNYRDHFVGYEIIGRVSNVISARQMYEYLLQTCARLRREYEDAEHSKQEAALFVDGLAYRLGERVREQHENKMREQRMEAERVKREQETRARHPSSAPTGTALVVVLDDYAATERDLNNDLSNGWAPGTTAAQRAERDRKAAERRKRRDELVAQGVDREVAFDMVELGWSREKAEKYEAEQRAKTKTDDDEPRQRWSRGPKSQQDKFQDRLATRAAGEGRRRAESVSLNQQVGTSGQRRIK